MPEVNFSRTTPQPARQLWMAAAWLTLVGVYLIASALGQRVAATATVGLMVGALLAASGRVVAGIITGVALAGACWYFSNSMRLLIYAPPPAAFAFMAFFFYRTLRPGSEALITRVARKEHPDLPPELQRYTRALTLIWTAAFAVMCVVALVLAPLINVESWSRIVHGMGYVLPAALLLGEYVFRHFRFPERKHGSLLVLIPNIVQVCRDIALARNAPPATSSSHEIHALDGAQR